MSTTIESFDDIICRYWTFYFGQLYKHFCGEQERKEIYYSRKFD